MGGRQVGVVGAYSRRQGEMRDEAGQKGSELEHGKHVGDKASAQ